MPTTLISRLCCPRNTGCIRDGTSHLTSYKGPRCEWSTDGEGTACKGYSLDGSAPTQTGSDTHIFDDRLGYVRKLHEQERLNIIGQPGLRFPSIISPLTNVVT
jgi:hypothetical protein